MSAQRPAPRLESVAIHFRAEIDRAEAQGVSRDDMVLHLTLRDMSQLKRDPSLALADISFAGGVMKYLGVKVVDGGVSTSALGRTGAA